MSARDKKNGKFSPHSLSVERYLAWGVLSFPVFFSFLLSQGAQVQNQTPFIQKTETELVAKKPGICLKAASTLCSYCNVH